MALVAVLSVRSATQNPAPGSPARRQGELAFAGQTLVEFQARQAHAAGAAQIAILIDDVTPLLTGTIDRLHGDGIAVSLIRDMPTLGRMISAGDEILLIGDGYVLPAHHLGVLAQAEGPRLLVLPSSPATHGFERIDASHMWAGGARASAATVYALIDMLGDWDFALALVRALVQQGATRTLCDVTEVFDGQIAIMADQATADAATDALTRNGGGGQSFATGELDDWPVGRPAALLIPLAVRRGVAPQALRNGSIGLAILGIVLAMAGLVLPGLLSALAALIVDRAAREMDRVLHLVAAARPMDHLVYALVLFAIMLVGVWDIGGGFLASAAGMATAGLIGLIHLAGRRGIGAGVSGWARFGAGTTLIILTFGSLLGILAQAYAFCAILALASLGYMLFVTDAPATAGPPSAV
jgi:hypothetical protein